MEAGLLQKIILLSVAFASFSIVITGTAVYRSNRESATHRALLLLAVSAAGWSLFNYLTFYGANELFGIWSLRLQVFFAVAYSFSLFQLFYFFPKEVITPSWAYRYLAVPAALGAAGLTLTPLVFSQVTSFSAAGGIEHVSNGPAIPVFGMVAVALIVSGVIILIRKILRASTSEKVPLKLVLTGTVITFSLHITFNLILPAILNITTFAPFGAVYIIPFVTFFTWAIVQHQFLNVKLIMAEIAVGAIILLSGVNLFDATSTDERVLRAVVLAVIGIFSFFFIRSVKNEVERREEVERLMKERTKTLSELELRNKNLATLQMISDIVLNENNTKQMVQKILDEIPKQLESCVSGLLSIVKEGKLTAYAISRNSLSQKVVAMIGGSLEKYSFPIKKEYNRIHEALVDKKSIDSDSLTDFISPPIPKAVASSIQTLTGAKHVEVFPLYASGEPLGVMLFVFNKPGAEVHDKNYAIAKAISDDLSLAVQRAQAFEQLKAANEYLAQLDKMKDEFISMASHELNTPLAAIEGYLSMILDEGMGKIDKQSRTYLSRAYASSKRLAELILDLLNVSRIEQGRLKMKYEQIAIAEMVESVIHELQIKADGKKIYLKIDIDKDLPKVWCDPDRIREVIVNLTGNAIKFTDKGGITIKASQPDPKNIRVQVVDTGRGIAKEDQAKLFQKFSQVKREVDEHQGSGLGLYISKNFVELHSGKIWVDSETGKGATFSFELPLIKEPPKEVKGAVLEGPLSAPRIERGNPMEVPAGIKESAKKT